MKKPRNAVVCACIWLVISVSDVSDVSAQTAPGTESDAFASKIHLNCKQFIYTVNAYSRIKPGVLVPKKHTAKNARWQRNVGTAIPIDKNGHLITLNNVVNNAEKIRIITHSGNKIRARIVGSDYTGSITVLKINDQHISTLPGISSLNIMRSGEEVFFLGVVPGMSVDVHSGIIKAIRPSDGTIEVSTTGNPGTSGTPVFDKDENILGLLAFQVDNNNVPSTTVPKENTYLVISLEYASVLARRVIINKESGCGWLGVCIDFTSSGKNGILISDVIKDSPAYKSHIKPLDRIFEFNGIPISTPNQFSDAFSTANAGETVLIKILRGNENLSFNVKLNGR